jgi:hypothetical protein
MRHRSCCCGRASPQSTMASLGAGSQGHVREGVVAGQRAAIKHATRAFASNADALCFAREVVLSAALSGIATAPLLGASAAPAAPPCIAYLRMECDLQAAIAQRMPLDAREVAFQLLAALHELHALGVVHRDVKPGNVLLTRVGDGFRVLLCDLGSACLDASPAHTRHVGMSTRWYSAPELLLCTRPDADAALASCRLDLWSAGCVIAEAISGMPLLPGEDRAHQLLLLVVYAHASDQMGDLVALGDAALGEALEALAAHPHAAVHAGAVHIAEVWRRVRQYSPNAAALCDALLRVRPCKRATAQAALCAPLFAPFWRGGGDTSAGVRDALGRILSPHPEQRRKQLAAVMHSLEGAPCFARDRIAVRPADPEAIAVATTAVDLACL